jgi:superkiller protein 3
MSHDKKITTFAFTVICAALLLNARGAFTDSYDTTVRIDRYGKLREIMPAEDLYRLYLEEGNQYLQGQEYYKASAVFWNAINLFPNRPDAYVNLAIVEIHQGNWSSARKMLEKAMSLAGDDYPHKDIIFYNIGLCAQDDQGYDEAIEYYQKAIEVNPEFGEAIYSLGFVLLKTGQKDKAFENFLKAKEIFEKNNQIEYLREIDGMLTLYEKTQSKTSLSLAKRLLEEASQAFSNGQINKAVSLLEQSAAADPHYAEAYYRLGILYTHLDHFDTAAEYFGKAIERDPHLTKAYTGLSSLYVKQQKYDKAVSVLHEALALDISNPSLYHHIGLAYTAMGKKSKASQYFKKEKQIYRLTQKESDK